MGTGQADEDVQLSTLVGKLNERFGTEFTPADQLFFDQVRETAVVNEQLRQAVMANSIENFEPVFNKQLENLFIERMDEPAPPPGFLALAPEYTDAATVPRLLLLVAAKR